MRKLSGLPLAEEILDRTRALVEDGTARGKPRPFLVSLYRDIPHSPFRFYARQQEKAAASCGIGFRAEPVTAQLDAATLRGRLRSFDDDPKVHGVIIEHPLPPELDFEGAVAQLRPEKDTDGVGIANLGRLVVQKPRLVPAVALAALGILRHHGVRLAGRRAGIVGRSPTVGLPVALLLAARGESGDATVTIAHSRTEHLREALEGCDVVFTCVGKPGLLTREVVPKGSIVVDIGLSSVPDPTRPSGSRAVGDADPESLEGWAEAITPVPGGVGPVTVSELMANVVRGWRLLTGESTG